MDIGENQLITVFAEREDERVGRREKKVEGGWMSGNVWLTLSSCGKPLLLQVYKENQDQQHPSAEFSPLFYAGTS